MLHNMFEDEPRHPSPGPGQNGADQNSRCKVNYGACCQLGGCDQLCKLQDSIEVVTQSPTMRDLVRDLFFKLGNCSGHGCGDQETYIHMPQSVSNLVHEFHMLTATKT